MGKTRDQGNLVSEGRPRLKSNRLSIGSDSTDYELAIKRTKADGTGVQLHLWNNSVDNTGGNVWSGIRFTGSTNDYETSEIKSWRVHPGTGLNSLSFNTGGVERMVLSSSGVGIGTNSPDQTLHLYDSSAFASFTNSNDTGEAGILFRRHDNNQNRGYVAYDFTDDALKFRASNNGSGEDLRIRSDGDVIVGNNSEDYEVNLGSRTRLAVVDTTNGALLHLRGQSPAVFFDASSGGNGKIYLDSASFSIYSGTPGSEGTDRFSISDAGLVTIPGTLNVRTAIDLADNDELRFGSGDDAKIYHNGSHLYIDMNLDDDIYIRDVNTSNATRLKLDTSAGDLYLSHQLYAGRADSTTYNTGVGNAIVTHARDSSYQTDTWTARTRILADWRGSANEATNEDTAVIMSEVKDRGGNTWPIYKIDPSATTWSRGSINIGRTRNSTTSTPTNYYTPSTNNSAGFYCYGGKNAITDRLYATAYWNRAFLRTYPSNEDISNADDRAALEINWGTRVDNGGDPLAGPESNTQSLDIDQGQRAKISGAGRGEFIYGVWAGRVESDENSPNSVYMNGESSVTAYAGNTSSANNYNLRTGHNGYTTISGRNTVDTDNVFYAYVNGSARIRFQADGNGRFDGGADIGNADYAEMFEWSDGNPNNEDRRGYSVVLVGEQIRPATSSDDPADILGVISGNPGVLGDAAALNWNNRYLKDEFGTNITVDKEYLVWNKGYEYDESQPKIEVQLQYGEDEDQVETVMRHPKVPVAQPDPNDKNSLDGCERWPIDDIDNTTSIPQYARDNNIRAIYKELVPNPDYDPNLVYVPRRDRQEWDAVGMLGKLTLRKGQPTGAGWRKLSDINDTLERWLVR